jgi:hypothetical protein
MRDTTSVFKYLENGSLTNEEGYGRITLRWLCRKGVRRVEIALYRGISGIESSGFATRYLSFGKANKDDAT